MDKPVTDRHFTISAPDANTADTTLSVDVAQATREASQEKCQGMTKGQQVSFESIVTQIACEMDEYSVEPQVVHVPHVRAIDENSLFANNATVGLEAPSVPQVAHPVGSPRVQDISMDQWMLPAFITGILEHNTLIRIELTGRGNAITLELSTDLATAK